MDKPGSNIKVQYKLERRNKILSGLETSYKKMPEFKNQKQFSSDSAGRKDHPLETGVNFFYHFIFSIS
ncbi:MAG: hypothetical protein ACKN9X_08595, partial [Candidatus Methylopumilus sp.]